MSPADFGCRRRRLASRVHRRRAGAGRAAPERAAARGLRELRARLLPPCRHRRPERALGRGPPRRAAVVLAVRRAARCRRAEAARAQPLAGRAWLGVAPFGDRDRQRRHALPGGHHHDADQPPGADAAPDRAPGARRAARCAGPVARGAAQGRRRETVARESWMHVEVDRLFDPQQRAELVDGLQRVLGDVRVVVQDWKPMLAQLHAAIAELDTAPAVAAQGRTERKPRVPAVAGRRPPDAARLPQAGPGHRQGRGAAAHGAGQRPGRAARDGAGEDLGQLRRGAGAGARDGAFADADAGGDAGQHAQHRAPPGLHRLCRHQALRRRRQGHRRASFRRAVHLHRLQRQR